MEEQKIKKLLERKQTLLAKLEEQMKEQIKAVDENDENGLIKILDAKESVIESLVEDDGELEKIVAPLEEKRRIAIAKNFYELGIQIEEQTEKINEMENECEKKLMNERLELFEKMKSLKDGRTLLKGYGMAPRIKPKFKGSI
ncbi:MAG: hypothetical protein VW455_13760 [Nitrospinota bacterium]